MEKVEKAIQDIYPDDVGWCYGCGRLNEKGMHLRTGWLGEDKTVTYYVPKEEQMAVPGFFYGGAMASLIDCHGTGSAALYVHKKNGYEIGDGNEPTRFVTANLNVEFLKPTPLGVQLKAIGRVHEIHPKRYRVETEVYADDELVAKGEVVAVVMPKTFAKK